MERKTRRRKVRYAVVGLGHIAQVAVLPAFAHAKENSELAAILSDDPVKRRELGRRYGVPAHPYESYEKCLRSENVDAVYIALPNNLHREFTVRAASMEKHVLCEKPMAVTEEECLDMVRACEENGVKLMIAYRLHFEGANLKAAELVRSGKLGPVRCFSSVFTLPVKEGNIRLRKETGGGTLYDIGVYCINAARYLFRAEPDEVFAISLRGGDPKFREVDEMTSAVMRFPGDRLASFTTSFGTEDVSSYEVLGPKGVLRMEPAYDYVGELVQTVTAGGKPKRTVYRQRDQFAPELVYFSRCVLKDRAPEPSGQEGMIDVRIIEALYRSSREGRPVRLGAYESVRRPGPELVMTKPPVRKPELVRAESARGAR